MRVHHLNCGTLHPSGGRLVDGDRGLLRAARIVCHCLLIETDDDGLVLIETGVGLGATRDPKGWLGGWFVHLNHPVADEDESAVRQIERLGFAAADVRHVVLTHLDIDHAGGVADFPHAAVHVHDVEFRLALERKSSRYNQRQFAHGPHWRRYAEAGEPWFGFDAIRSLDGLPPEILLVPLAGHTRGHTGVAVDTGDGWLLHAGDAFMHDRETDPVDPGCPPGLAVFQGIVQQDRRARLHNRARLRELRANRAGVRIIAAHDPVAYARAVGDRPGR